MPLWREDNPSLFKVRVIGKAFVSWETRGLFFRAMFRSFFVIIIFVALSAVYAQESAQDFESEIQYQSQAIRALKKEIAETRARLKSEARKEQSTIKYLSGLEEEISLLDRLVNQLAKEENQLRGEIERLEGEITEKEDELQTLQERYARRVVRIYKRGTLSDLEKVLSSTSWRQAVYRTQYLRIISDIEERTEAQIRALLIDIGRKKLSREAALRKQISLRRERETQVQELRKKKRLKEKELRKIRQNKNQLARYLEEKQAGIKQLEAVIKKIQEDKARFERAERIRKQQEALKSKSFDKLRGKIPWPAEGRVIARFGRQWNPKLKTTTENPGIDIKGKPGSPIRAVMGGIVTTITYIRGYGTTIIIDHGGGFYTVYSHVTNVKTGVDQEVRTQDVIAYMGDSGSVNGSKLHFEIWGQGRRGKPRTR